MKPKLIGAPPSSYFPHPFPRAVPEDLDVVVALAVIQVALPVISAAQGPTGSAQERAHLQ